MISSPVSVGGHYFVELPLKGGFPEEIALIYSFEDFEIDTQNYQLRHNDSAVDIEPKVFDLLSYLIHNRERLVTRDELFENVWPGQVVSDTSLSNQIKEARKAIGDSGRTQLYIKTVHGRGYQFAAKALEVPDQSTVSSPSITERAIEVRSRAPVIAVLPFQNLSSDAEQNYFCEGMSEDITTELSRFSDIQVIARHSAFQFISASYDIGDLAAKLGADYVVEGSARRAGNQVRINVQLIETDSQEHVWAERYDFPLEDIFEVQDNIIETVVSTITGRIRKIEIGRAKSRSTENLSAYEHLLRGLSYHKVSLPTHDDYVKANAEFNKAIELDPGLARAYAWRLCSLSGVRGEYSKEILWEYIEDCKHALALDEKESEIHRLLGAFYFVLGEFELGKHHINQARRLNPNDSHIIARSSLYYIFLGEIDEAKALIDKAMLLNPLHPGWYWSHLGMIYFFRDDYKTAADCMRKNTEPSGYDHAWLAVCYTASGDHKQAKKAVEKARTLDKDASIARYTQWDTYKDPAILESIRERMAVAGLPA
jgi:TolB-like protein/Flp pilus assembly protein TadD